MTFELSGCHKKHIISAIKGFQNIALGIIIFNTYLALISLTDISFIALIP